jgi:hypothetical protein
MSDLKCNDGGIQACTICHRKILVERTINGSDHDVIRFVTCWDCLNPQKKALARKMYNWPKTIKISRCPDCKCKWSENSTAPGECFKQCPACGYKNLVWKEQKIRY